MNDRSLHSVVLNNASDCGVIVDRFTNRAVFVLHFQMFFGFDFCHRERFHLKGLDVLVEWPSIGRA